MTSPGKLFFFCGKMGAGKSTMSKKVADQHHAVLISEDDWLSAHYPTQIKTLDDYMRLSSTIKPFIQSHVEQILKSGTDVVMDFPANTAAQRAWFASIVSDAECDHELIYLDLTDAQCLSQIGQRRLEQPERAAFDNETTFYQVTQYFEAPQDDEAFHIVRIEPRIN
ncbi:1-deoxy-D-xylulose-5-phosphate synthase [Terasakiispira papahanaumokuakeensis]|uniref:1-deoxy-D-xylulose-5-phosphate synthase n=1 Tax=Terasakiispira papahanaumokuakeensis TaxID=197479 RepID=A0A1E2V7S2_9GAMM|nr:ATP-binding protein [Terasakiispira papahanaumokuakeensis]ODC02886.1 1-deoxy-D-xylulose-5-phosphate synthase [Terasakiispira papahanaumokuakeensis]